MIHFIKKYFALPMYLAIFAIGSFGMFANPAFAAVNLQSSFITLRAANHSDCPTCINWNAEGPTHATGDAQDRPIVALVVSYKNNSTTEVAQGVRVRMTPTQGSGGTTYFSGYAWGSNAPQISGNATVTIPSGQTLTFTGDLYWYQNGSSSSQHMTVSASQLTSGVNLGNIPAGQYGGLVAHFEITGPVVPPPPTYNLDVQTLSAQSVTQTSAQLRGQSNAYGNAQTMWFEYATNLGNLSSNGNGSMGGIVTSPMNQAAYNGWLSHFRNINSLVPGTTYYYKMCATTGTLTECDPYESFTTQNSVVPPPPPAVEDVQTNNPQSVAQTSATLSGIVLSGTNLDTWFALASTTSNPSCSTYVYQQSVSGYYNQGQTFQVSVSGLQSNTMYYYRACSTNDSGQVVSFTTQNNVVPPPAQEAVQTSGVLNVTQSSATLQGFVLSGTNLDTWFALASNTTNPACSVLNYQQQGIGYYSQGQTFQVPVSGLQSNTTYYYRACSPNSSGNVMSFMTGTTPPPPPPPSQNLEIDTLGETNVDEESAELNGYVANDGSGNVSTWFAWDDSYTVVANGGGSTLSVPGTFDTGDSFARTLSGLDADTTYYYRACGEDSSGDTDCGSVESFTTDDANNNEPDVETENASNIEEDSARMNGSYDMNDFTDGDIFFVWSDDEDDLDDVEDEDSLNDVDNFAEVEVVENNASGNDDVSETISGLDADTTYYYRLCALYEDDNNDDVITCGGVESFTTDDDQIPDNNDGDLASAGVCVVTNLGTGSATLTANVQGNGNNTNAYFQYGPSTGFGFSTGSSSIGSGNGTLSKFVSGLTPNTTYYCRVVAQSNAGTAYGDIGVFKTLALPVVTPDRPVTVVSSTGGSGSPIFLEIDNDQEMAVRGQTVAYDVRWENTSRRDLDEVVLNVRLPKSVQFVSATAGRYNKRDHMVTVSLGELEAGEEDDMTIFGRVTRGTEGDQLVAEAIIAFEDPQINTSSLLSAIEYDVDTFTQGSNALLAGLFGIGLLPGIIGVLLAILLILIIIVTARRLTDPRRTEYRGY